MSRRCAVAKSVKEKGKVEERKGLVCGGNEESERRGVQRVWERENAEGQSEKVNMVCRESERERERMQRVRVKKVNMGWVYVLRVVHLESHDDVPWEWHVETIPFVVKNVFEFFFPKIWGCDTCLNRLVCAPSIVIYKNMLRQTKHFKDLLFTL